VLAEVTVIDVTVGVGGVGVVDPPLQAGIKKRSEKHKTIEKLRTIHLDPFFK
jgi:hypothetical protein